MSQERSDKEGVQPVPLNCDPDAARWAREFMEVWNKNPVMDEGWMLSWFANAIVCGEDTYRWRQEKESQRTAATHSTPARMGHDEAQAQIAEHVRAIEIIADEFGYDPYEWLADEKAPLVSAAADSAPGKFTLDVCEELFGCFLEHAGDGEYRCSVCETTIPIGSWVTAPHSDDCMVAKVREFLARHRPYLTPGVKASTPSHAGGSTNGSR